MKPVYAPHLDLIDILEARVCSPLPQAAALRGRLERRRVARGATLFRAGERVGGLFLMKAGILKFSYRTEEGVERVRDFISAGQIATCVGALGGDLIASYDGIACEDTVIEGLDFAPICRLTETEPLWARCISLLLFDTTRHLGEREHVLLTLSPSDRLAHAVAERPWLLTRVPQQDLAAHIGITPVSLSRLKARARRRADAATST